MSQSRCAPRVLLRAWIPALTPFAPVIVLGAWVAFLYRDTLSLPLFGDDVIHFRWLDWHTLPGIWRSAEELGYFRPVPFSLWKMLSLALDSYDPFWLHAMSLSVHFVNSLLVFTLARRILTGSGLRWAPGVSALFFAAYPFSYAAVPYVGAFTHPIVTLLVLLALNLYWRARTNLGSSSISLAAAIGCAALAPLANESGAVVALMGLFLELVGRKRANFSQSIRALVALMAAPLPGIALWFLTPKSIVDIQLANAESLLQSGVYFLQGLIYPVVPLGRYLMTWTDINDLAAIALVALGAIPVAFLTYRRFGRLDQMGLFVGWWAVALAPAWLFRGFDYLVDAPRVLYLSSVGTAMFWAAAIDMFGLRLQGARVANAIRAVAVVGILVFSAGFVRQRMDLYSLGGQPVLDAVSLTEDLIPSDPVLIVNFVSWLAPKESTYPLGHEGVTVMPPYVGLGDLIYINSGVDRPVGAAIAADLMKDPGYYFGAYGEALSRGEISGFLREGHLAFLTEIGSEPIRLRKAGSVAESREFPSMLLLASYDEGIDVLSASCEVNRSGVLIEVTWRSLAERLGNFTVFAHLYESRDRLVSNWDRPPLEGLFPFPLWQSGDVVRDVRTVPTPRGLPEGIYQVRIGLYDPETGHRLTASGPWARPTDDSVLVCEMPVPKRLSMAPYDRAG